MVSFGDAHVILFVVSLKVQEKYNGIITSLMRKEELIKLFNQTIIEVGTEVDDAYNRLQLVKNTTGLTLDATFLRLQEANHYLLELHLFIAVVQTDVCVLQKQALESKLNYEKRFALAKYFASINEAFKKLYGFPKENGPKNKVSSRWGKISTLAELMSEELKAEYDKITDFMYESSRIKTHAPNSKVDLSVDWWNAVRTAESHFDVERIIEQRRTYEKEDQLITDCMVFFEIMGYARGFVSKFLAHLNSLMNVYIIRLSEKWE